MDFIHHPYRSGETIAAIATPPGEGGVAIIRISGDRSLEVADRVFSGAVESYVSHTAHFGQVVNSCGGEHVDDVLLLVMHGPRSYTGDNTVEIHCHGGSLITRRVLEVVLDAGARAARPGEFTFKAFMNGKIDLAQAEAVQELIAAKNQYALNAAEHQLQGALSQKVALFQKQLTETAAILEAWVDFPEEGLEFASVEQVCSNLEAACMAMQDLVDTFHDGRIAHDGISLCIAGGTNVGKSSLMNAMLDKDRAIVSHIPGTTRDVVEDYLRLNGLNLRVTDTAGIRSCSEAIEQEGIRRSRLAMASADLVLLLLDVTRGLDEEGAALMQQLPQKKTVVVWNKIDLEHNGLPQLNLPHIVKVSAKERRGLEGLQKKIDEVIWDRGPPSRDEVMITNVRHHEALGNAIEACRQVVTGLRNSTSPEFLTIDMRECLTQLGNIIGTNITEDILSAIFSKFCVGK